MNNLLKHNLCYFTAGDVCRFEKQKYFFNTGLMGAIEQLQELFLHMRVSRGEYKTYVSSDEFEFLSRYGHEVMGMSMDQLVEEMKGFIMEKREEFWGELYGMIVGMGVPVVLITMVLAVAEIYLLKRKVKRVMTGITYIPTAKFHDKIILSLIKSVLQM